MNILLIAKKEIKHSFRDIKTLVLMLAFPIAMMLILGTALSNAFSSDFSLGKIHVLYKDSSNHSLSHAFSQFTRAAEKSDIYFIPAKNGIDGKKELEKGKYDGYAEISNRGIHFYGNEKSQTEASVVQGMLTSFLTKYKAALEIAKTDPHKVTALFSGAPHTYIKETALHAAKQPGSMDYYAIAMTTMIAFYGSISASFLIRGERTRNTSIRLVAAPISKLEIFIGKVLGSLLTTGLSTVLVVFFSMLVFKVDWGSHMGLVLLVILAEILFAISFGLGLSYITGGSGASRAILMIVVQFASFFGGAYFPIEDTDGFLKIITDVSPLKWANTAISKIIYTNDLSAAFPALSLFVGLSALFLAVSAASMHKREGL